MSEEKRASEHTGRVDSTRGPIAQIPMWKKLLVAFSLMLMVVGGAMSVVGAMSSGDAPDAARSGSGNGSGLVTGFAPTTGERGESGEGDALPATSDGDWSPALFKLGFSFFVGFAIAFALRTFVKISIIAIGMFLLIHFALEYYGFISVNWDVFDDRYDSVADWLGRQTSSFRDFITGSLPSAASATAGLVLGFRKG